MPTTLPMQPGKARPILLTILVIIVALFAWVCIEVYHAVTATPNIDTDYASQMEELAAGVQGEGPNRWADYIGLLNEFEAIDADVHREFMSLTADAFDRIGVSPEVVSEYQTSLDQIAASAEDEFEDGLSIELTPEQEREQLELAKSLYEQALLSWESDGFATRFAELRDQQAIYVRTYPRDGMLIGVLLPELGRSRTFCRWLKARAVFAAERGEWETVVDSIEGIAWLAERTEADPIIIGGLVGIAIRSMMFESIRELTLSREVPPATLTEFERILAELPAASFSHALSGELLWGLDAVQHSYDSRGRLMLSATSQLGGLTGTEARPRLINLASAFMARRETTERKMREYFDLAREYVAVPPPSRRSATAFAEELDELAMSSFFLALLAPALDKAANNYDRIEGQHAGVRVLVAIERFRAERGVLPDGLSELVPDYFNELPADLWSPNGAFGYLQDNSELGYVLYSVGADGADNGGMPADHPTSALVPGLVSGEGTDYLFTRPAD